MKMHFCIGVKIPKVSDLKISKARPLEIPKLRSMYRLVDYV